MTKTTLQREMYTTPRPDVVRMLRSTPQRVLDIGCSDGSLSATFSARGADTCGIEYDPEFAEIARTRLARVLEGDALDHVRRLVREDALFDTIICADSLEHMVEPEAVLGCVRSLLAPNGQCVVSLPNVRFYTTFTNLALRGRWPMLDRGVHDRTHLRWFTDLNAREMFAATGFTVEAEFTHYRVTDKPIERRNRHAQRLAVGPLRPFLAYQYVYLLSGAPVTQN